MTYLHDIFELALLGTLIVAVWQILWLRKKMSEIHDKVCCDKKEHGQIDDELGI